METLGVDIGGVIISRSEGVEDTSFFGDNYLATPAVPGAFEALARLVNERFDDRVHLISKCGRRVQEKTLEWLAEHDFYERTGIIPHHVQFCRGRSGKAIITDDFGVTHFIDDRLEVLSHLVRVNDLYLFQPRKKEVRQFRQHLSRVRIVQSWPEVTTAILGQAA